MVFIKSLWFRKLSVFKVPKRANFGFLLATLINDQNQTSNLTQHIKDLEADLKMRVPEAFQNKFQNLAIFIVLHKQETLPSS